MTPRLRWRPAQHNQITLSQLDSEVVNPTGLAENKGLIVSNGSRLFAVKKTEKQEAVDCIAIIKRRTGVHSSLEVSLHKTIWCWVNKLQPGNWQLRKHTKMQILDKMNTMRLIGHYNKDHRPPIQLHLWLNNPPTEISSEQTMGIKLQATDYCVK